MAQRTRTLLCILLLCTSLIVIPLPLSSVDSSDTSLHIEWHEATEDDLASMRELMCVDGQTLSSGDPDHGTGLIMPTFEEWESLKPLLYSTNVVDTILADESLPSSVDHTQSIHFPPVGNQTSENSCLAWSLGYYIMTYQEAVEHNWDLSGATCTNGALSPGYQDMVFSPDFMYHQLNNGYDGGLYASHSLAFLENMGMCTWDLMPNKASDHTSWPSEAAFRQAPIYRSGDSYYCAFSSGITIESLKTILDAGHLAFIAVESSQYSNLTNETWTLDNYNNPYVNHANTIVGYDDSRTYQEGGVTRQGAFKVINSWGTGWPGDTNGDGCYWISYEAMRQRVRYYYYVDNITAYEPESIATFTIDHDKRGECDITFTNTTTDGTRTFTPYGTAYTSDGGLYPFPTNTIAYDVSEIWASGQDILMGIYDSSSSSTTGTLTSYSIEYYPTGYTLDGSGAVTFSSTDTPVATANGSTVTALAETNATTLELSASQYRLAADGTSQSTLSATLLAADGTPMPDGTEVTFSTDGGTLSSTSVTTTDGSCSVTFTASSTPQTVTISASTEEASDSIELYCIGDPHSMTLEAVPSEVPADGSTATTITATVLDVNGTTVLDGTEVTFSTDGGTLSSTSATTTDGSCSITLTSTEAKTTTVSASSGDASETVQVGVMPGPPASIDIAISPSEIIADGTSAATVTVTVRDQYGNLVADGTEISLATTAGTLAETTLVTASGTASTTITSTTVAQVSTITATCEGIEKTSDVTFIPGPTASIDVTPVNGRVAADGSSTTLIEAVVTDANGNTVSDDTSVSFSTSAGTLSTDTALTTDGVATVTLTAADSAQTIDVTASIDEVTGTAQVVCVGPPATISLTACPDPVTLNTTTDITATVTDVNGEAVLDGTVTGFTTTAGSLSSATAETTDGIAVVTLTAPDSEQTIEISASSGDASTTLSLECVSTTPVTRALTNGWNSLCFPFSVEMSTLVANIQGDYDGYLYWFDSDAQRYKYYNVVEATGEPEYESEFTTLPAGQNIWLWLYGDTGSITIEEVLESGQWTLTAGWNVIGCTASSNQSMQTLIDELDARGADYDGYIYWLDPTEQRYKYYNVVEVTGEPEYESEFTEMIPGQVYWVYCYS